MSTSITAKIVTFIAATILSIGVAQAAVVDFEGDAPGSIANGFVSGGVTFNDTNGSGLQIFSGLPIECASASNHCLANFSDDVGALQMIFPGVMNSMSLDFGNDQAGFLPAGGLAFLQLFLGNVQVGTASVVSNLDDIMNQTVSYSGAGFDNAFFSYTDGAGNPIALIEVVDNINFTTNAVPEPGSFALIGLALAGLGMARRTRKAS